jgi:peptidase E
MEAKIFLHGGNSSNSGSKNNEFFQSFINSVKKSKVNILCVYFARPINRWGDSFQEDKQLFLKNNLSKEIELTIAKPEILQEQIKKADIIFLSGGMRGILREVLMSIDNLEYLLKDKVVVGVSAGANILSTYYYSSVANRVREGIGYLPIKLFTHYNNQKKGELKLLKDFGEDIPTYTIPEEEFIFLHIK